MAAYEILFKESVWKDRKKVPKRDLKKILSKVEKLGDDPRPTGCEKLTGEELYRVRQRKLLYSQAPYWSNHRSGLFRITMSRVAGLFLKNRKRMQGGDDEINTHPYRR